MKTTRYIASILLFVGIVFSPKAFAQTGQVVDKIIAKVDDKIVLKSELEAAYVSFLQSPQAREFQGDARCLILNNFIENKVMLVMSDIDSVQLDPSRVDYELQGRMQRIIQRFGSEKAIQEAYGKSVDQFMDELRPQVEEQLMVQQQEENVLSDITVTPNEVRKFFKQIPEDSLPLYSVEYEIGMIMKEPVVNDDAKEAIRKQLMQIREDALSGQSFEILATTYSQGPSAGNGGNLGYSSRGTMDPAFEAGALALKPGEVSMPVESQFGFHIIQLLDKRGNEYDSRHILIVPQPTAEDTQEAMDYLDSLKTEIEAGNITFEEAAKEYSDDKNTSVNGGFLQNQQFGSFRIPAAQLDPELFFEIDKLEEGAISKPQKIQFGPDLEVARIIYYKKRVPPHRANLSDDYEKLRAATLEMKKVLKRQDYLEEKLLEVYLEIDPEYKRCNIVNE